MRVQAVKVRYGSWIDAISLLLGDGVSSYWTTAHGGTGGQEYTFTVPDGSNIVTINVISATKVYAIQFVTNKGLISPLYGGSGGVLVQLSLGGPLLGLYGRWGLDNVGFIYGI